MHNRKWWFKTILAVVLGLVVTTGTIPTFIQPVKAQGVFGNKRQGSQSDEDKQKQEQDRQEREKAEQDRRAKEDADRERQARERAEQESREKTQREQEERQRRERDQAERDRQAKEQAEKERQAQEAAERDRQAKERAAQEERDKQAKEQAERDAQDRALKEQADKDRQQKDQEERDRIARDRDEHEKQLKELQEKSAQQERTRNPIVHQPVQTNTNTNTNANRDEDNNKVSKPVANDPDRRGGKFTRTEEKPKREREDDHDSRRYHPEDHYPYDPGYRNYPDDNHGPIIIPVPQPLPMPNPPDDDDPGVIVIERGPSSRPEPEPPTGNDVEPVEETTQQSPEDNVIPDTKPKTNKPKDIPKEKSVIKKTESPVIPAALKRPAKAGSPEEALNSICLAWLTRDDVMVKRYVNLRTPIRIYNRGKFSHKMTGKEFLELTSQALKQTDTREFNLKQLSYKYGKIYAGGSHSYIGQDGELHKTALNYTLKKINNKWTIVEVGFSPRTSAPQPEG